MEILIQLMCIFSIVNQAFAVTCLSCKGVLQPRYCTRVRQCPQHNTCGVQKYLTVSGETRYDVDCVSDEICHFSNNDTVGYTSTSSPMGVVLGKRHVHKGDKRQSVSSINLECSECCKGDLCNSQGCGISGYPSVRGPICYGCSQESNPTRCETLTFCRKDQMCGLYIEELFGDKFYSSRCVSKYECSIVGNVHSGFGKRQAGAFNERICDSCCSTDLCNQQCEGHPTSSSPSSSSFFSTFSKISTLTSTKPTMTSTTLTVKSTTPFMTSTTPTMTLTTPSMTSTTPMPTINQVPTRYHDSNWTSFVVFFKEQFSRSSGTLQVLIASETSNTIKVQLPKEHYSGRIETHSISSGFYALGLVP